MTMEQNGLYLPNFREEARISKTLFLFIACSCVETSEVEEEM